MRLNVATSDAYEAEANRLRAEIGASVDALRRRLTPSNMASEAAARAGIADLSWAGALDYASKRHPVPTAVIGFGIALWAISALRKRARRENIADLTGPLRELSELILDLATRVFRERAEAKRREFVDVAQAQVASGAAMLSDQIEKKLETFTDRVPGGIQRPTADRIVYSDRVGGCAGGPAAKTVACLGRSHTRACSTRNASSDCRSVSDERHLVHVHEAHVGDLQMRDHRQRQESHL